MAKTVSIELIRAYLLAGERVWGHPLVKTIVTARQKLSKDEAYYTVINRPEGESCKSCRHRIRPNLCSETLGKNEDAGWCMSYLPLRRTKL